MTRPYLYYPAWDGKAASPLILKVAELCQKRWAGTKNIGTYSNRLMKNDHTVGKKIGDPGMEKYLSTHATGYALDLQYKDETQARAIWDYFLANSETLGIQEIHWYAYGEFGAGYRCSRGEGKAGVKIFTKDDNAGSYQGNPSWLHLEVDKAIDPAEWERRFRATKPA